MLFVVVVLSQLSTVALADSNVDIEPARQKELVHLLRQDCGSCHGMTLKGGLGTALTPDVMATRPIEYLYYTVREGHSGTPMPPWKGILSDDEIMWIVTQLKEGLPER